VTGRGRACFGGLAAAGCLGLVAMPLAAQDLCGALTLWSAQSGTVQAPDLGATLPPPTCGRSLSQTGQGAVYCSWGFAYRDAAATALFSQFVRDMAGCFTSHPAPETEAGVNHPDSYDLRRFEGAGSVFFVSLKDKGGLAQSFVFLRATAP